MPDPAGDSAPAPEDAEARQARRWSLLVETARLFAASLDEATVVRTVVRRASDSLHGLVILSLLDPDGSMRVASLFHPDPAVVTAAAASSARLRRPAKRCSSRQRIP